MNVTQASLNQRSSTVGLKLADFAARSSICVWKYVNFSSSSWSPTLAKKKRLKNESTPPWQDLQDTVCPFILSGFTLALGWIHPPQVAQSPIDKFQASEANLWKKMKSTVSSLFLLICRKQHLLKYRPKPSFVSVVWCLKGA